MSKDFFGFEKKKEKTSAGCTCAIRKKALYKDTYNELDSYNEYIENEQLDILILLEFKEFPQNLSILKNLCTNHFKGYKWGIIPALGCTNLKSSDVISTYKVCKQKYIKKNIVKYKPKVILCIGKAIYTITEVKNLKSENFFIPIKDNLEPYYLDDCFMYSPEFNCNVYPVSPLYQWINQEGIKDCYENKFFIEQTKRIKNHLQNYTLKRRQVIENKIVENENEFIQNLINSKEKIIAIDIESTGLNPFQDQIFSIQFATNIINGYFLKWENINKRILIALFNTDKIFVFHNGVYDTKFLKKNGIYNARCDFDTMLASHTCNENSPQGLKPNAWLYTNYGGYDQPMEEYHKKFKIENFTDVPIKILFNYACYDVVLTFQLYKYFKNRLELEDKRLRDNYYKYIIPAISMIVSLELNGVQVDMKYMFEYSNLLKKEKEEIEKKIYKEVGRKFNINSNKQLSEVLKDIPNFKILKEKGMELITKNKDLQLNKNTLPKYAKKYPFVKSILKLNHLIKELSQLGVEKYQFQKEKTGFLLSINDNRIHASYKLHGTGTGRAAGGSDRENSESITTSKSFGVNFQNIPSSKEFRKLFLPSKDCIFARSDYDGMEVCIFSQISGSGKLEELLLDKKDMHCTMATKILQLQGESINYEEMFQKAKIEGIKKYEDFREAGKICNFQLQYGVTPWGLAHSLGISKEEAQRYIDGWYELFPEAEIYIKENRDFAKKNGYVFTLLGRKRRLPQLTYIGEDSYYNKLSSFDVGNLLNAAINSPVQGTSGQTTLIAMTKIYEEFEKRKLKSKLILNVHDELMVDCLLEEKEEIKKILVDCMIAPYYENKKGCKIRLSAEVEFGEIWKYSKNQKYWEDNKKEYNDMLKSIENRNKELEEFNY